MAKTNKVPITVECIDGDGFHIFTFVKIGKKKVRVLIDTGASKTVLSQQLADHIPLLETEELNENLAKGIGNESIETQIAVIQKIKLGRFSIENLTIGIMGLEHISDTYTQLGIAPFELILGGDVLHHFSAVISYDKKHLKLKKP